MSTVKKVIQNSSASFISFMWTSILFIVTTPIMIAKLGVESYGIYALAASITGFLGFVDFGFNGATVKQISENYIKKDYKKINNAINLSIIIYTILGTITLALLFVFVQSPLVGIFKVNASRMGDLRFSLNMAGLILFTNLIIGIYANISYAIQRYSIQAICSTILNTFSYTLIVVSLFLGFGVKMVMSILLLTNIFSMGLYFYIGKRLIPNLAFGIYYNKSLFKEMFSFSVFNMFTQMSQAIFGQLDKILLSTFKGVSSSSYYVVPLGLSTRFSNIITSIATVLFPLTSELESVQKTEKIILLYKKSMKYLMFISTIIVIPVFLYSNKLLTLWVGKDFADKSTGILRILLISAVVLSSYTACFFMNNGMNKPKINALYVLISNALRLIACVILIPSMGIKGAAWALLVGALPVPAFIVYFERTIQIREYYFLLKVYLPMLASGTIIILIFSKLLYKGSKIILLGLSGLAPCVVFIGCCIVLRFFDKSELELLTKPLIRYIKRIVL